MRKLFSWLVTCASADDDVRRRGRNLAIMALGMICTALLVVPLLFLQPTGILTFVVIGAAVMTYIAVLILARRGRATLGALLFIAIVTLAICAGVLSTGLLSIAPFFLVLPLLIASLSLRPRQIWPVLAATLLVLTLTILALPSSPLGEPDGQQAVFGSYLLLGIVGLMSFLGASSTSSALDIARRARAEAETAAHELSRTNADLEATVAERTAALRSALDDARARADEQARLLVEIEQQRTTLRELSVPVIPISSTTLIMPLVGSLDATRLRQLQEQALHSLERTSARYLILDITGVPIVDTQVAQGLLGVVQAARLLGAEVRLVGIRPEVAQAIVGLGISLQGISTASDLESALKG